MNEIVYCPKCGIYFNNTTPKMCPLCVLKERFDAHRERGHIYGEGLR